MHLFVCSFVTLFFSKSTNFFLFLDTGQEVKVPRVSKVTEHLFRENANFGKNSEKVKNDPETGLWSKIENCG